MKNVSTQQVMSFAKCSKSAAIELVYSDLHLTRKLYTNRRNYASSTMNWLSKNFHVTFKFGNDAPRGGKAGSYVTFESNDKFEEFAQSLIALEHKSTDEILKREAERRAAIDAMVISDDEKAKYLAKVADLSRKQARKVAHNFAAKKLGFYSTLGMEKFFNLDK